MKKKNIGSLIGSVMVIMIASRLLALLSSQIYMSVFGTDSIYINIYSYAINIPNIIFTCIGTALSTVVIPIYVGHRAVGEMQKAKLFADNIITVSTVLTLLLVIAGICIAPLLVSFTGFASDDASRSFAVKSLMIVMPVMFFYAWNYIFQGMLQSEGKFWLPAFVSVPSSLIVIAYVLFLSDRFGVTGLLFATVAGLALQALILVPPLYRVGYRYRPLFRLTDPDTIKAGKMTVPVLLGVGAYQLNMLFNSTMIARYDAGMVTILTFVQNITIQLVLAFVYSITAVVYPKLSESAAKGDMNEYKQTLGGILKTVSALLVPISAGFIAVREPLLDFLVAWGKVTGEAVAKAEVFLSLYAVGIIGIGLKEILDRALYSVKNTKISAVNGFVIMAVNVVLSLSLMPLMGAYGIPLAYSLASITGLCNLLWQLRRKVGSFAPGMGAELVKSIVCSCIMIGAVWCVNALLGKVLIGSGIGVRIIRLAVPAVVGVVVYAAAGAIAGIGMVRTYAGKIFSRFSK